MPSVIYIDILLGVNLFINYLLLCAARSISKSRAGKGRMLGGTLLATFYCLVIFLPDLPFFLLTVMKFLFAASIVAVTFGFVGPRIYIKNLLIFFFANFLFGGAMVAVWLMFTPPSMLVTNGVMYINISALYMIITAGVTYLILKLISMQAAKHAPKDDLCKVKISVEGKSSELWALYDTGNRLTDVISGAPVMIAEYGEVEPILPEDAKLLYSGGGIADALGTSFETRYRVTPYQGFGGGGLLPSFRADFIDVKKSAKEKRLENVVVAVTQQKLSDGEFRAIVGKEIGIEVMSS